MWRMPLYKHYSEQIESDVADIRNTGKKRYGHGKRKNHFFIFIPLTVLVDLFKCEALF